MTDSEAGHLFIGGAVDPSTHDRLNGGDVHYEASNLTTHGVIVGMTGSGKTGLGIILLEEALLQGVPTLVIDPKGDMGNLMLSFPDLDPNDFKPWVDATAAESDGESAATAAANTAAMWRKGLEGWGIGPDRIRELRQKADFRIYTPGSTAGIPLNVLGSLKRPSDVDDETVADEVEGFASSILGLVGIEADPLSSRDHILISNLVAHAWKEEADIDLAGLIEQIQRPPMRKLGVIELDTFFPPQDRVKLAMKLNGLIASPAFASWNQGVELDIESLLYTPDGQPRCAIVSIAHLSDDERQFVVTLILSKMVTWMRSQPGTSDLRALIYMDEVFGFVPPTAAPPSKKPILTILKQARAFGVGMVLSTQNPVDLDYKAISNAGTWMVGRLQTERDKGRLLEGMTSASGAVDIEAIDATISGLGKREFLLYSTKQSEPTVFTTRWAMSYLAGPMTREQIKTVMGEVIETMPELATKPQPVGGPAAPPTPRLNDDETTALPAVADGVEITYLDPAAPWGARFGVVPRGKRLQPALAVRVQMIFDETKGDLRAVEEWEAILFPIEGEQADMDDAVNVDYDERDFRTEAPDGSRYVLGDAKIHTKAYFANARRDLKDRLYRGETLDLQQNKAVKAYSRPDETPAEFARRCADLADELADADVEKFRKGLEKRIHRVNAAIDKAEDRVREAESKADNSRNNEVLSGIGDVLGGLLGGRNTARSVVSAMRRAGSKRKTRQSAAHRVKTAENRLDEKVDELEDLEQELVDSVEDIVDDWDVKALDITEFEVALEKADISVEELKLVWIPT